ncbi:alpha-hydroxy acid oxidase [Actinomadura rugatobispora]|uniref:Alpha-hydroxy acid oxidase n=1 Tax=Actinomadura rugatobispora TaxID=1994 RepID=A0ABW0ZVI2_9ACTN|nr:alpha-hydroxy acid oxidase [Actinomadura rugatobispora]
MELFGFDVRWTLPERLLSIEDYRRAARRRLPAMVWNYIDGGADDLVTLRDNRSAFDRWSLVPGVLKGIEDHDTAATVAGIPLALPVLLAPTGASGMAHWRTDLLAAAVAERMGTRYVVSTASSWSLEEIAEAAREAHLFQLYPRAGTVTSSLMRRAWSAGYRTMMVTVDVPVKGSREGERRTGMRGNGLPPILTPRTALNFARHPRWTYDVVRHQRFGGYNFVEQTGIAAAVESLHIQERELMQSTLNWDDVAWMRDQWKGALYLKGILNPEDAEQAVRLGFDGVVVSNHGGRQLDFAPASLDALPDVAAAVGGKAEVLLDGGVRRGSDVVKALALGASAVMIGRPYLYGVAVSGAAGVRHVLEILREEIVRTLTLMGVASVGDLDRSSVTPRHHEFK